MSRSNGVRHLRPGPTSQPSVVQKDRDARWTKKQSHYGYKNHVTIDRRHKKSIRRYRVTDAAMHDSQVIEELLTSDNTASGDLGGRRLPVQSH